MKGDERHLPAPLPDPVDVQAITAVNIDDPEAIRNEIRQQFMGWRVSSWRMAILLAYVRKYQLYRKWHAEHLGRNYHTMYEWARAELGFKSQRNINKYADCGALIMSAPEEDWPFWMAGPVTSAAECRRYLLKGGNYQEAKRAYEENWHQRHLREALRIPGPATASSVDITKDEPLKSIRLIVSESTHNQWTEAASLLRVNLGAGGSRYPSDDEIVIAAAQTILQAPELTGRLMEIESTDPSRWANLYEEVLSGQVRCWECRSYSRLEKHHVIPRSHGGVDADGKEVLAWLCHDCHEIITRGESKNWRDLAEDLGVAIPASTIAQSQVDAES